MKSSEIGRKLSGAFEVLLGLGLLAWVFFDESDIGGGLVLSLCLASILLVTGALAVCTRRDEFKKRPIVVTCSGCNSQRPPELGFLCPECGSARLLAPRFNRLAVASVAFFLGVPSIGFLCHLVGLWLAGAGELRVESIVTVPLFLYLFLFAAASSAYAAWMGQAPRWPSFLSFHIDDELENALHNRMYALALMAISFVVSTGMTTAYVLGSVP